MSEEKSFWEKILSRFGIREKDHEKEIMDDYRNRITKEKIAELSEVIDSQVETLVVLEKNWQATYERVERCVKERDEQDAAFAKDIAALSQELQILGQSLPAEDDAEKNRRKLLKGLFEESRFYIGMADTLKELLAAHKACVDDLFERTKAAQKALGGISGVTLQAAMLSARFGEDAGEFAAVCDKVRIHVTEASSELGEMVKAIETEQQAYEDTFGQLANLTDQLFKNRDAVAALYEGQKEIDRMTASRPRNVVQRMTDTVEGMQGRLRDAGEASRGIEAETNAFTAINEQEAASREEIEAVVQEIQRMITEE
ncbi:MAG: hypothetical protein IJT32_01430 [Lachnospiraceae bacterium]|nr:hypothetical protein [Lachnospiraceae bacterium]